MSDGVKDPAALARALEANISIPLDIAQIGTDVGPRWAVRPCGVPENCGFWVVLSTSLHTAEASLVMDRYSGPLLRRIGDRVALIPEEWWGLFQDAEEAGSQVWVEVNGVRIVSAADVPLDPWSSVSIELSRRLQRGEAGSPESTLLSLGSSCLASVVAALEVVEGDDVPGELEGTARRAAETRYERSPINRLACIEYFGATCWVCDFSYGDVYGSLGAGFIVVHHVNPVAQMGAPKRLDPRAELVPLCANCHYMVHKESPPIAPEVLRQRLGLDAKHPRPASRW